MPDLPNREQFEADVAAAVAPVMATWQDKLQVDALAGNARSPQWYIFSDELNQALIDPLTEVYVAAAINVAIALHLPFDPSTIAIEGLIFAQSIAPTIAAGFSGNTAVAFDELMRKPLEEKNNQAATAAAVALLFSPDRAERLAITETTRTISIGEMSFVDRATQHAPPASPPGAPPGGGLSGGGNFPPGGNPMPEPNLPLDLRAAAPGGDIHVNVRREGDELVIDGGTRRDGSRRILRIPISNRVKKSGQLPGESPDEEEQEEGGEGAPGTSIEEPPGRFEPIWRIDPRSNVCKICRGLNGQPRSIWFTNFPAGPPAHPNCRCYLDFVSA